MFLNEDTIVQCAGPVTAVDNTEYLIWDADDGDTPFSGTRGDYGPDDGTELAWLDAMGTMGKITRCVTVLPSDLSIYKGIIYLGGVWNFGGENQEPMTDAEAESLIAFVQRGGDLYIEEPNFGTTYWLYGSPSTIALFDELHCTYTAGNPASTGNFQELYGVGGSGITDGMSFEYPYQEDSDHMVGVVGTGGDPDCRLLFSDEEADDRGTIYTHPLTGSDRIYAPFILGALEDGASPSTKTDYISAVLSYFESNTATGIAEEPAVVITGGAVEGVFPNPFNPKASIEFSVARDGTPVEISVFDVAGRLVKTLAKGTFESGRHSVVWTGIDQSGVDVGSGVYLYRASIGDVKTSGKMVLLK
jgi:hypothetical protein